MVCLRVWPKSASNLGRLHRLFYHFVHQKNSICKSFNTEKNPRPTLKGVSLKWNDEMLAADFCFLCAPSSYKTSRKHKSFKRDLTTAIGQWCRDGWKVIPWRCGNKKWKSSVSRYSSLMLKKELIGRVYCCNNKSSYAWTDKNCAWIVCQP